MNDCRTGPDCAVGSRDVTGRDELPESPIRDDAQFEGAGWTRRHIADPVRARESIELYESLGFDVATRDLAPEDFGLQCRACASAVCRSYVLIYTRRKAVGEEDVGQSSRSSLPDRP